MVRVKTASSILQDMMHQYPMPSVGAYALGMGCSKIVASQPGGTADDVTLNKWLQFKKALVHQRNVQYLHSYLIKPTYA